MTANEIIDLCAEQESFDGSVHVMRERIRALKGTITLTNVSDDMSAVERTAKALCRSMLSEKEQAEWDDATAFDSLDNNEINQWMESARVAIAAANNEDQTKATQRRILECLRHWLPSATMVEVNEIMIAHRGHR